MMLHIDIDSTVHVIKDDSCQETYTLLLRFKSLCGPALHFHLPLSTIIKLRLLMSCVVKKSVNIIYLSREFHKKNSYNETVIKNYKNINN